MHVLKGRLYSKFRAQRQADRYSIQNAGAQRATVQLSSALRASRFASAVNPAFTRKSIKGGRYSIQNADPESTTAIPLKTQGPKGDR